MDYYRKAAAVFIVVISLMLPFFMEVEEKVAVVELETLVKESQRLNSIVENKDTKTAEKKIRQLIEESAAELAAENHYSSVITKYAVYKGGENITEDLVKKIDEKN